MGFPLSRTQCGVSGRKGGLGEVVHWAALGPDKKPFTMEKSNPYLAQASGLWHSCEPRCFSYRSEKNQLCDPINFLLKTLKNLDFLSFWKVLKWARHSAGCELVTWTLSLPDFS